MKGRFKESHTMGQFFQVQVPPKVDDVIAATPTPTKAPTNDAEDKDAQAGTEKRDPHHPSPDQHPKEREPLDEEWPLKPKDISSV